MVQLNDIKDRSHKLSQIKEREGSKEGLRDDKNVVSGEGEGRLSSVAEEETVGALPGGDGGHTQEIQERLSK